MPHLPELPTELDPVIEAFKKDVDRTLLRENLKLTPLQRLARLQDLCDSVERLRGLGSRASRVAETPPR